jgi:hypothetical protein
VKRLCKLARMPRRRSMLTRKPPWLDPLSAKLIGLGKSRGGNVGRGGASPTSDPISQSCVADVQGPE